MRGKFLVGTALIILGALLTILFALLGVGGVWFVLVLALILAGVSIQGYCFWKIRPSNQPWYRGK